MGYGPLHPKSRVNGATMAVDESVAAPEKWEVEAAKRSRWEHVRFAAYAGLLMVIIVALFTIASAIRETVASDAAAGARNEVRKALKEVPDGG